MKRILRLTAVCAVVLIAGCTTATTKPAPNPLPPCGAGVTPPCQIPLPPPCPFGNPGSPDCNNPFPNPPVPPVPVPHPPRR